MDSLSLSLSVSCDDRFSPNPSRSPSPSPVFLAPVPTLASLERQIHNFADRCSQEILGKAFYDLSKDIVFAATKRESMTKVLKIEPKVKNPRPSLTETQDTTSSSFLDGLSIKTDSIVDDVFETNTSCDSIQKEESNNQYEILRPISELPSSLRRYQDTFGRPRYESETYFRPISAGNPDIPQLLTRKSKYRSLSESDNVTSLETNKLDNELITSPSSCFKPVSRKFEFEVNSQTPTDTDYTDEGGKLDKGGVVNGHLRHPKLKSRRRVKKNVTDQETQCSADEIKRVTGWISRRERFKSVHHMKEVESKDFIFSKDGASISLLTSLQEGSEPTADSKTVTKPVSKVTIGHVDLSRTRAVSEPAVDHDVQRPQVQPRSKSVAKQSTIDSGYSDENGHSCGNQPIRPETSAHPEGTESPTKRSSPDGVNRPPSEDQLVKSENSDNFDSQIKVLSSTEEELNSTSDVLQLTKSENTSDRQNQDPTVSEDLLNRNEKDLSIDSLPRRNPNLGIVVNGYVHSQSDTIDKTHPFGSYWEELLYHLENDPTFPVQEFINRVKSISMDIECNQTPPDVDLVTTKEESGQTEVNEGPESKQLSPQRVPVKPNCCRAQGCGIQSGIVGSKNNFQVNTQGGGDGSLGVSIRGPRKHTVTECSVIYTGDDFYEVLYEVSLAGFYVISVKWSDRHITDSPFIVKVSF
ncbi:hypothetical protein BSL78_10206 [Apostichopus japonicus]|uniref:Uncharacterized protein n=1 Tax=Stichopus japonicus TaxID=307972 RepID=A0A2G8KY61_STIJA|nr:hypothetical protein BSL78_10206 [Apostichopus japonicus]